MMSKHKIHLVDKDHHSEGKDLLASRAFRINSENSEAAKEEWETYLRNLKKCLEARVVNEGNQFKLKDQIFQLT